MKLKSIAVRTVSGLIYVAIMVCGICFGEFSLWMLAMLLAVLAIAELEHIANGPMLLPHRMLTVLTSFLAASVLLSWQFVKPFYLFWIPLMLVRFILEIYYNDKNPLRRVAVAAFSQIYIAVPLAVMTLIGSEFSTMPLLALLIMIWLNDTGAFLVGSACGRHRLFERISPKKSWEGFFGGLGLNIIAAILFGLFCPAFFALEMPLAAWIGLACLVTVFSTWGDLFESMVKRSLDIKDSGNLIPGHGGILDRIDSMLFVIPAAYVYLTVIFG